ncbi:MAG: cyclic nucleotide-binding domain-containing protein [Anaerolineae bacterium]|nr:cyclic nucleotide-binding domain-containing protein [Anaerolineae bacterium]MDW8097968.1 cyclic nucleotide-binding domain-containing protein [Anaerolineae bacterium]
MVPLALFRQFPFFASVEDSRLTRLAAISAEISYEPGEAIFEEGASADRLYLVLSGAIELWMHMDGLGRPIPVGVVGPGEVVGWSTLVPPHQYTARGEARGLTRVVAVDSVRLRRLVEEDHSLGYYLYRQVASVIAQRLHDLRLRLASLLRTPA